MAGLYSDEINSRADFLAVLDETIAMNADMLAHSPGSPVAQSAAKQLAAIKLWMADGRTPTEEERYRINIGIISAREFDDPRMDWSSPLGVWVQRLGVINTYMDGMPSDEVAANPPADEDERIMFWRQKMLDASR